MGKGILKIINGCYYKRLLNLLVIGALAGASFPVWSSAFALNEQNAKDLGTAYAGAASSAEDASTGYYNPAGLTRLRQEQIAASGVYINSQTTQTATRVTTTNGALMGAGSARGENQSVIPALHYAKRIDDRWMFGLNIVSPFGLKNNFKVDAINRYMGTRAELRTTDIGPSFAYGFNNGFSIGAGVDALYAQAKFDFRVGNGNPATDGFVEMNAANWGLGYHAGALYEFNDCHTRVGLHYRSKVKINAKGDGRAIAEGLPPTISVRSSLNLPESAVLSIYHAFNEQWAIMGDAQWMRWNRFKELRFQVQPLVVTTQENFKNAMRYAVGVSYQLCNPWKFKVGAAFDKTPTRDLTRTTAIPDQNRTWAAVGVQYHVTKNLALDFGYAHIFFKKANINQPAPIISPLTNPASQTFQGTSKTRADLIGMQVTWDFG